MDHKRDKGDLSKTKDVKILTPLSVRRIPGRLYLYFAELGCIEYCIVSYHQCIYGGYIMNLLQKLQGMLGDAVKPNQNSSQDTSGLGGALSSLLGPAMLGGLAGALLTSKAARGIAGGALLAGTGAAVWNQLKTRMRENNAEDSPYPLADKQPSAPLPQEDRPGVGSDRQQSTPGERAERLVRALVFAAKSDGHIDEKEQAAIYDNLARLNIGGDAQALVQQALKEPLDPALLANGVKNEDEALEVYALSCAVVDVDHFMERSYLDALAEALKIPADVKKELEKHVRT